MLKKLCFIVRIITVSPVMATTLLTMMHIFAPEILGGLTNYLIGVICLAVLPVLAYPIQPIIPGFRGKGRDGQRMLAIIMSVLGYVISVALAFVLNMPDGAKALFLTYLFSGTLIFVFSKLIKVKASGHTCGVAGPVAVSTFAFGTSAYIPALGFGIPLLALVFAASLGMKRHKWSELILGSIIPVVSMLLSMLIVGLI